MKIYNRILRIIFMCAICLITLNAQNPANLTAAKRNELIALAKEVVLRYGPDYYREYGSPVIEYKQWSSADKITDKRFVHWAGKGYYRITFPYDKTQEKLAMDFSARVDIWADTSVPKEVMFGNGMGRGFWESADWRNDPNLPVMEYVDATEPILPGPLMLTKKQLGGKTPEQYKADWEKQYSTLEPIIVVVIPEEIEGNPKKLKEFEQQALRIARENPVNKDELLRRGWVFGSDGNWSRTRPDVPPHRRKLENQQEGR